MPKANSTKLKKVSYQDDYLLGSLLLSATLALNNACTYMQSTTPYGDDYLRAFNLYKSLRDQFDEFEDALAGCVEARKAKGAK